MSKQHTSESPLRVPHPSTIGWMEYLIGGTAVLISAISLQIGVSSNATQERLLAASTWPFVQFLSGNRLDDGKSAVTLNLQNAGVGPAWVQTLQVFHDGVAHASAGALLSNCCDAPRERLPPTITSNPARVMTAGESVTFMRIDKADADPAIWDTFDEERWQLRVVACYCSVLEECWVMDSTRDKPLPIKQCPPVAASEQWHG